MVIYFIFLVDNVRLFLSIILFTFYGNLFYFLLDKFMFLRIILSINTYVKSEIFQELWRREESEEEWWNELVFWLWKCYLFSMFGITNNVNVLLLM